MPSLPPMLEQLSTIHPPYTHADLYGRLRQEEGSSGKAKVLTEIITQLDRDRQALADLLLQYYAALLNRLQGLEETTSAVSVQDLLAFYARLREDIAEARRAAAQIETSLRAELGEVRLRSRVASTTWNASVFT